MDQDILIIMTSQHSKKCKITSYDRTFIFTNCQISLESIPKFNKNAPFPVLVDTIRNDINYQVYPA